MIALVSENRFRKGVQMPKSDKPNPPMEASLHTKGLNAEQLFEVEAQENILKASEKSIETREAVYKGLAKR